MNSKTKTAQKRFKSQVGRFVVAILCCVFCALCTSSAHAAFEEVHDLYTDSDGVRWEWIRTQDSFEQVEPVKVSLSFYDKPENATTVVVPSFEEIAAAANVSTETVHTYYLKNTDASFQDEMLPTEYVRRDFGEPVTKLDLSKVAKIQIQGIRPILDPDVEAEIVFGPETVISDVMGKKISAIICGTMSYSSWNKKYNCYDSYSKEYAIPGYNKMTREEQNSYAPTYDMVGCIDYRNVTQATYDPAQRYCSSVRTISSYVGVFADYKLKLTNFDAANFNYVGWETFADSDISGETVTINGDTLKGGNIFARSNIKYAIINTETVGAGVFRGCQNLEEITFGEGVTRIADDMFAGTNLTSFDFSTTGIKTIGPRAFEGANLTDINLDGVNRIEYMAFKDNDIRELTLPKSINYLQSQIFKGNGNMKKLTVAYDTLTSGTTLPMFVVLDNYYGASTTQGEPSGSIEELHVIAPYAEGEEVSDTHVLYADYLWRYNAYDQRYMPECPDNTSCNGNSAAGNDYVHAQYGAWNSSYYDSYMSEDEKKYYLGSGSDFEKRYAHVDTYKNVIAPIYFANLMNLHKITIDEGYEFIGASAFHDWSGSFDNMGAGTVLFEGNPNSGHELNLPESLRGIGNGAFVHKYQDQISFTIPRNIEFIGINAFFNTYFYDGDVDFPNLLALGDHAFEKTRVRNIHLYDKLQYMGAQVFSDCAFINDITFDLDVFSPDIYIAWALPQRHGPQWYDGQFHLTTEFGPRYPGSLSVYEAERYGVRVNKDQMNNYWPMKFGTITFTEKNVSPLPGGYNNCYYGRNSSGYVVYNINDVGPGAEGCPGGSYGTGIYNTFFGHINADKVDISKTAWKVLSPRMFVQTAIDEVLLPENLEVIPGDTFSDAYIKEELVIPDTVKVIGDAAFDYGYTYSNAKNWSTGEIDTEYLNNHTIHITKLPASLEYVGNDAFWADYGLEADLNSQNLRHIGYKAFWGTRLEDVYLPPTVKSLHAAAFANISTLHDITIDFDLGALPPNYDEGFNPNDFPESAREFAGANLYNLITMSCSATGMANSSDYPVTTFYSLFNQKIVEDEHNDPNNPNRITAFGQKLSETHYGTVRFTKNAVTDIYMTGTGYFSGLQFDELDLGETGWKSTVKNVPWGFEDTKIGKLTLPNSLESFTMGAFQNAKIDEPFEVPDTLQEIGMVAFQEASGKILGGFAEGLTFIGDAAFYAADMFDDLVIPETVESVGSSAFNAGYRDNIYYDTIRIEPYLDYNITKGQKVHQMFYNVAGIDQLYIDSEMLPVLATGLDGDQLQEFYAMPVREVYISSLPAITNNAFDECDQLEKVDFIGNSNLYYIGHHAFNNNTSLRNVIFGDNLHNNQINVGEYAFNNTAIKIMTDKYSNFDLTAANFTTDSTHAFSNMPVLKKVSIPSNFNENVINDYTFADDPELEEVTLAYQISELRNGAFMNDSKLGKLFVWGDTVIEETDEFLEENSSEDTENEEGVLVNNKLTIPSGTNIFAYSDGPTEEYAMSGKRSAYAGKFYPLDEVLYITSNRRYVVLNDEKSDFDKTGLQLYALRRDGVILQSNEWLVYTKAYPRSAAPGIVFEESDRVKDVDLDALAEELGPEALNGLVLDDGTIVGDKVVDRECTVIIDGIEMEGCPITEDGIMTEDLIVVEDLSSDDIAVGGRGAMGAPMMMRSMRGAGRGGLGTDESIVMNVYDAQKPFELISLNNRNFEATTFTLEPVPNSSNPKLTIHYTDGYTVAVRDTAPLALTREQETELIRIIISNLPPEPDPAPNPFTDPDPEDLDVPSTGIFVPNTGYQRIIHNLRYKDFGINREENAKSIEYSLISTAVTLIVITGYILILVKTNKKSKVRKIKIE